jgi:hypothetical protein
MQRPTHLQNLKTVSTPKFKSYYYNNNQYFIKIITYFLIKIIHMIIISGMENVIKRKKMKNENENKL